MLDPSSYDLVEDYSGPLDLLLDLVRKQEMDIFQIDIYKITSQYVEYLNQRAQPDLEGAGDFIRLASLLLYIKSKSLLPKTELAEEDPQAEDLKNKLSRLLAHYQIFQKAGELLSQRAVLGRDCWKSPGSFKPPAEDKINIDTERGVFKLIQSYHAKLMVKKAKESYKILKPIPDFFHRLRQTAELWTAGARLKFSRLALINKEKYSRLLSFLSILELSKAGFVSLIQKQLFSNIEIFVKKTITEESLREMRLNQEKK